MSKTKHRSVYIAGPMTGLPDYNYPAFNEAAARWRQAGWEVKNPAEHFGGDQLLGRPDYLRAAIEDLLTVDGIALLPGWMFSDGAKLEVRIGIELGLNFYSAESMAPIPTPTVLMKGYVEAITVSGVPHGDYHAELADTITSPRDQTFDDLLAASKRERAALREEMDRQLFESKPEAIEAILGERQIGKPITVLDEAALLVENGGDRNDSYDHPYPNFSKIAAVWNLILGGSSAITPQQVALMMIGMKLVREAHRHKRDNIVDIVGYARCHERLEEWDITADTVRDE